MLHTLPRVLSVECRFPWQSRDFHLRARTSRLAHPRYLQPDDFMVFGAFLVRFGVQIGPKICL